jgi:hypothetical protein
MVTVAARAGGGRHGETHSQLVLIVRVAHVLVPPAAWNGALATCGTSLAMESHSGSLPDVESSMAPLDARGVPFLIVEMKLVARSRSVLSCVHRHTCTRRTAQHACVSERRA